MLELPFFKEVKKSQNILLAGAGGGFDIFSCLPLYFGLQAEGKKVHLANLSFSFLPPPGATKEARLSPTLLKVTADTPSFTEYFPERFLAQWLREQGRETPIYCFERTGVKPLLASYQALVEHLGVDTIILVDGGTDSLMRGDEAGLGTPHEDISSIISVNTLNVERQLPAGPRVDQLAEVVTVARPCLQDGQDEQLRGPTLQFAIERTRVYICHGQIVCRQ